MGKPWRNEPRWRFEEANPDPHMRPSTSKLLFKLRSMSILKDHPDTVEIVIGDLMYQFLFDEKARPQAIFRVMERANALWRMAINDESRRAGGPMNIDISEDVLIESARQAMAEEPVANDAHDNAIDDKNIMVELGIPAADSGAVVSDDSPAKPAIDWADTQLRGAVADTIERHFPTWTHRGVTCGCHRSYAGRAAWANHVRIHVWRVMRDEFPTFGKLAEDAIGHTVTVVDE